MTTTTLAAIHDELLAAILDRIEANRSGQFTATVELEDADGCVTSQIEATVSYEYFGDTDPATGYWEADTAEVSILDIAASSLSEAASLVAESIDIRMLEHRARRALRA